MVGGKYEAMTKSNWNYRYQYVTRGVIAAASRAPRQRLWRSGVALPRVENDGTKPYSGNTKSFDGTLIVDSPQKYLGTCMRALCSHLERQK